jgi:selenide,water dikinase
MAVASKVSMELEAAKVDFLPGALECSREGYLPGGLKRNVEFLAGCLEFTGSIQPEVRNLLCDPQTSGGLLFAVAPSDAPRLLRALREQLIPAQEIGEVTGKSTWLLRVR